MFAKPEHGGSFIGAVAFQNVAGQVRYSAVNGILQADVNGDGTSDFSINIANKPVITADDSVFKTGGSRWVRRPTRKVIPGSIDEGARRYLANCLYLMRFGITLSSPSLRFLSSS